MRAGSHQLQPPVFFSLSVAKGPYSGVVKLQTMRCLFEAYEHVLSLLERVFTPMFCHSDEVRAAGTSTRHRLQVLLRGSSACLHLILLYRKLKQLI